jgi:hypothetical protein
VNTAGGELVTELTRICTDNELVISRWSAMHLRTLLKQYYWKADKPATGAQTVWQDTLKFLYLPRLRSHSVFEQAIQQGVASEDFFGTALGEKEGRYEGFQLGVTHVQVDDSLLLLEPGAAKAYKEASTPAPVVQEAVATQPELGGMQPAAQTASKPGATAVVYADPSPAASAAASSSKMKSFHGSVEVNVECPRNLSQML